MTQIKYMNIVNEMSEAAFKQCSRMLFRCFHYRVMTEGEFRKVDLKEQLLLFQDKFKQIDKKTKTDISDAIYAGEIKTYLDAYVNCKDGSRAAKYKSMAVSIVEKVKQGKADTDDLTDLTIIFIGLMRESFFALHRGNLVTISDLDENVNAYDEYLLTQMKDYDFKIPQGFVEKGLIQIAPDPIKKGTKERLTKSRSQESKDNLYMIATLFYIRAMQKSGGYSES